MAKNKTFTSSELELLKKPSNAHVAYADKVYDVSSFVSRHPGGYDQIMSGVGHDITQLFKSYHKPETFSRVLSKYYVGELVDRAMPVFAKESDFYVILNQRVKEYCKENGLDPKISYWRFFHYIVLILLYYVSMYITVTFHDVSLLGTAVCAAVWGNSISNIAHTYFHDTMHFAITHNPHVWRLLRVLASSITGISDYTWRYRHVFGHHIYTNVVGYDPDIDVGDCEKNKERIPPWRIQPSQKWAPKFKLQHLYAPCIFYMVVYIKLRLQDISIIYEMRKDKLKLNPLTPSLWLQLIGTKSIHILFMYALPIYFIPFQKLLLLLFIREVVCSFTFAQFILINHINEQAVMIRHDKDKNLPLDWATLQVSSTVDFCTDSQFWCVYSGYLNHQTAHHLFPGYNPGHYHWITPIVKRTCAELGVQYNCVDTFTDILRLHYGYLKKMGNQQDMEIIRNKKRG